MIDFKSSETAKNLIRAFAGESQARNRYTLAAGKAKKQGLPVIESVFLFTAGQELAHADVFYDYLKELKGQNIRVDGAYPVDQYESSLDLLKAARHNEYEEFQDVYQSFGNIAREEGFEQIAGTFFKIAEIEKLHGDRFQLFADYLEKNQLFVSEVETGWMCLNCGFVFRGNKVPASCPVCSHEQGYFIRLELAPYIQ
ncbi:MAG: rubrerythrin family protein [Lachnospiraceae bacterium]|nr:rubrerythrin family protein [Lachnospiraceae bacterium]